MLSTLIFNFLASLIAVSVSGTVVLHDTRLDKAFISTVSPASDTTVHDFARSLTSEMHVHSHESSGQSAANAGSGEPAVTNRSHKKHIAVPYERMKLAVTLA